MPSQIGTRLEAAELYLTEIDAAIVTIHEHIEVETARVRELRATLRGIEDRIEDKEERRRFRGMNPDPDDEGLGTMMRWELHFDDLPEHDHVAAEVDSARQQFDAAAFAVEVLCGALMQFAKQAVSIAFAGRPKKFAGRKIHDLPVGEIAWAARNQAMHFEEGRFKQHTTSVFDALAEAHPGQFTLNAGVGLAHRVFDEFKWHNIERLRSDLREMTGLVPARIPRQRPDLEQESTPTVARAEDLSGTSLGES